MLHRISILVFFLMISGMTFAQTNVVQSGIAGASDPSWPIQSDHRIRLI